MSDTLWGVLIGGGLTVLAGAVTEWLRGLATSSDVADRALKDHFQSASATLERCGALVRGLW